MKPVGCGRRNDDAVERIIPQQCEAGPFTSLIDCGRICDRAWQRRQAQPHHFWEFMGSMSDGSISKFKRVACPYLKIEKLTVLARIYREREINSCSLMHA